MAMGRWNRGRIIGRGSTATVSLASAANSGDLFAVKSVELAYSSLLHREQAILSSLDCEHVVSCLGHDLSAGSYNLFLEYAPGGSLADEIARRGGSLPELSVRSRAREVLAGLAYLHSRKIVHCDIKSQNILICSDGHAKIADLGCAKLFDGQDRARLSGTPMFMAPEVARGECQGPAADVWALGCVAIEMATGRAPWPDVSDAITVLHRIGFSGDVPESPEWMSDEGKDFLSRCLRRDPEQRWTAAQLLSHPFLQNLEKDCKWTSPKSILDHRHSIWESLEVEEADDDDDDEAACVPPQLMIAELVGSSSSAPNWTWNEDWLIVRTTDEKECEAPEPEPEPEHVVGDGSVNFASRTEDTVIFNNAIIGNEDTVIYALNDPTDAPDCPQALRSGRDDLCCGIGSRDLVTTLDLLDYRSSSMNCNFVNRDQFINERLRIMFHSSYCFCFHLFLVLSVVLFLLGLGEASSDSAKPIFKP